MRMECDTYSIFIYPENRIDEVYLESVLGLKKQGDFCIAKRENAIDLNEWAWLEITKKEN